MQLRMTDGADGEFLNYDVPQGNNHMANHARDEAPNHAPAGPGYDHLSQATSTERRHAPGDVPTAPEGILTGLPQEGICHNCSGKG